MQKTKGTIFINYRKDDSNWNALALYQELQKYFSKDQIFKDFNAISPGDDFVVSINSALQSCDVLLVLIGKSWLQMKDEDGTRRLEDPNDFVRLEIAKALDRNIKVVPVLLDRTPMPRAEDLPENLQSLCRRQFVEIDPTRFEDDVRKLAEAIRNAMKGLGYTDEPAKPEPAPQPAPPPPPTPQQQPQPAPTGYGAQSQQQFTGPVLPKPPKPDNNLVWGIVTTLLCCLPLGILSIVKSTKVDSLYDAGKYPEAQEAADLAKKYATWAAIAGAIALVLYMILIAAGAGY